MALAAAAFPRIFMGITSFFLPGIIRKRYLDHGPGGGSFPKDLPGDDLLLLAWNNQAIT